MLGYFSCMDTKSLSKQPDFRAIGNAIDAVWKRQCELEEMDDFNGEDNATMSEYEQLYELHGILQARLNLALL